MRKLASPVDRAQLPMALLEAAIGVVLVLGIALGFGLGVPTPDGDAAQLDAYAGDALVLLEEEPPRHGNASRLAEVVGSEDAFDRERASLDRRLDRILPDNLMYRLETPHGAVGQPVPSGVPTGVARTTTVEGAVHIRVWYA
jgi:hypothetical protein